MSHGRAGSGGFTMIELLVVTGAVIVIMALTMPVGITFYRQQALDETASEVVGILRRARSQAGYQRHDSAFGVKFLSGSYVLFEGSSYAARTQSEDETFVLTGGITTSGIDELVFAKRDGTTTAGTLTVISGSLTEIVDINAEGKVERQ
jgi:Tfp pilus assembly protein FimT